MATRCGPSRPVCSPGRRSSADGSLRGSRRRSGQSSTPPPGETAPANPPAFNPAARRDAGGGTLLVASPKFKLQYAVEDAGPNGPATVELWITQDGGRTWIRRGDDPDRVSPIEVDLGGEGTYGLCLVARSASGLGDQPPAPVILLNHGSRSTARPPRSSSSRLRSVPESTPARWRSPGGRATFTCRPDRFHCPGGPTSPAHRGRRSPKVRRMPDNSSGPCRQPPRNGSTLKSRPSTPWPSMTSLHCAILPISLRRLRLERKFLLPN